MVDMSLEAQNVASEFIRGLISSLPALMGIDQFIPGCVVVDMDPYAAASYPRFITVALRGEYHQDAMWRGNPPLDVGDTCTVIHFLSSNLYEVYNSKDAVDCSVFNNAVQAVAHNVWTLVLYNSEYTDPHDMHSVVLNTGRVYCVKEGSHAGIAYVNFDLDAVGIRFVRVMWNDGGVVREMGVTRISPAAFEMTETTFYIPRMTVGDYIYVEAYQDSGAALNIRASSQLQRTACTLALWRVA